MIGISKSYIIFYYSGLIARTARLDPAKCDRGADGAPPPVSNIRYQHSLQQHVLPPTSFDS